VIDGVTGWLAKDEGSLVDMAVKIWREGGVPGQHEGEEQGEG